MSPEFPRNFPESCIMSPEFPGISRKVKILPSHLYGVFEKLRDPDFFKELRVTDGFVSWPGDIDIAPDAMYREIKSKGTWVLE
jgi:uncharacterized protein DUF2442